ncbi:MAG: PIN domain-containing protein [bacterium]
MRKLFIDTSAFYSLEDKYDQNHHQAIEFRENVLVRERFTLFTSTYVLDETYTFLQKKLGKQIALTFGTHIQTSKIIEIVHVSKYYEKKAWDIFKKYLDKDFSYTDCPSFAIMEDLKITNAFTFDTHFQQKGFIILPHQLYI